MSTGEVEENLEETPDKRNPVLKEALSPIIFLLKVFGLYYENDMTTKEGVGCMKTLTMIYGYGIFLVLLYSFGKSVAAIFYQDSSTGYDLTAIFAFYNFKCLGQSFACLKFSSRCSYNILRNFIDRVEAVLSQIKLRECKLVERRFKRRVRIWLYVFAVILIGISGMTIVVALYKSKDLELWNKAVTFPMPVAAWSYVISIAINIYSFSAFFLPTALCGVLTQSLAYAFDEYYRCLRYREKDGLCIRKYIKDIREHFVTLTTLCCNLDDMMAWIFMVSYLTDIITICLLLRVGVYGFTDLSGRLPMMVCAIPPIFSLLVLSHYSSNLNNKGQEMILHIQQLDIPTNLNMDTKTQLDLLLFHLSSEPVVLTIWKMVPLYKSVIVSIFVSIITYFALIISL